MEDLISSLSGSMHVSQDGYDLKAIHAHLAKTIFVPPVAGSTYHPLPASRSTSCNRGRFEIPEFGNQPAPSPMIRDEPITSPLTPSSRPGFVRSSSYGFSAFEGDAFAPLRESPKQPWSWKRDHLHSASDTELNQKSVWGDFQQQPTSPFTANKTLSTARTSTSSMWDSDTPSSTQQSTEEDEMDEDMMDEALGGDDMDCDEDMEMDFEEEEEPKPTGNSNDWGRGRWDIRQ